MTDIDVVPPQDIDSEQKTLGAMMEGLEFTNRATDILRPDDFYRRDHRVIFDAILSLRDAGQPIDANTIETYLRNSGRIEEAGGKPYVISLQAAVPCGANVDFYAKEVRKCAICRDLIRGSSYVQQLAYSKDFDKLVNCNGELNLRELIDARDDSSNARVAPLQAAAFLKYVGDPPDKVVEEILPDMQLTAWAGKPKAGKSLFVLDLAHAIASRRLVFGRFAVNKPGPVLIVDMENPIHEIANRLLKRGIHIGSEDLPLYILSANFRLDNKGMSILTAASKSLQPVLIIIDSAREALGVEDWNDAAKVVDKIRPLRIFAQKVCPVLIIAHNRKAESIDSGDEISGSNAFTGALDGWISLKKTEFHADRRLTHTYEARGRGMLTEFTAEMSPDDLHVKVLTEEELQRAYAQRQKEQAEKGLQEHIIRISDALQSNGSSTVSELADVTGLQEHMVRRRLAFMKQRGVVQAVDRVRGPGAGKPSVVWELITNSTISIDSPPFVNNSELDDDPPAEDFE